MSNWDTRWSMINEQIDFMKISYWDTSVVCLGFSRRSWELISVWQNSLIPQVPFFLCWWCHLFARVLSHLMPFTFIIRTTAYLRTFIYRTTSACLVVGRCRRSTASNNSRSVSNKETCSVLFLFVSKRRHVTCSCFWSVFGCGWKWNLSTFHLSPVFSTFQIEPWVMNRVYTSVLPKPRCVLQQPGVGSGGVWIWHLSNEKTVALVYLLII